MSELRRRLVAITHVPSPNMQDYARTYVDDQPIDLALANTQHAAYCDALRICGCEVVTLDVNRAMADCVFVEDTAVVLDEIAVMMSPGAASRRREPEGIEPTLRAYRDVEHVRLPATIDGGDVVVAGRQIFVGHSARTNDAGIAALRGLLAPRGYTVTAIPVTGCLHLKTACSYLPDGRFLVNRNWIDVSPLPAAHLVDVPSDEPWAGDVLVFRRSDHCVRCVSADDRLARAGRRRRHSSFSIRVCESRGRRDVSEPRLYGSAEIAAAPA